jgi:putative ABC transport system ATP-binding protein
MIRVKNLKKIYPGKVPVEALRGVTFEVKRGEFIAVMGRSGAGKSTMLHQLGLLDNPTSGEIVIDDVNALKLSDSEKRQFRLEKLGYIFQEYTLMPELTALENVYLPSWYSSTGRRDYKKAGIECLERVELGHRLNHLPHELSGGEQQRVGVARALVNNPKILLADEPCATLDSESAEAILRLLTKLNKELGQTIVMVSHEPEDKKYVERVIYLRDGLIEKIQ